MRRTGVAFVLTALAGVAAGARFAAADNIDGGVLEGRRIAMAQFVNALSHMLGRPVIDETGYAGAFDVHLEFAPESVAALWQRSW